MKPADPTGRLAMEVVDEMKLDKIVKQSGFRREAVIAKDCRRALARGLGI